MSFPEEETPKPEEPTSSEEQSKPTEPTPPEETTSEEALFPEEPVLPEGFIPLSEAGRLPLARRRRAHRRLVPDLDERTAVLDSLGRRAFPSFEFFLFALLCGAVMGAAYLMDSPALLLLGVLLAPLLTPWVGMALAIQTGSWRFFFLTLGGILVAGGLVFLTGALAGLAGKLWLPLPLSQADYHSHLWWPELFLVVLGAVLLTVSFIHSEQKPILPSIMLAYGLFLPLSASGVGLGIGTGSMWPNGALVSLIHLALATLVAIITLAALRFKPAKAGGILLPVLIGLLCLAALVYFTGLTKFIREGIIATRRTAATPTVVTQPTAIPTASPTLPLTPTYTPTASETPQPTDTAQPTPAYAVILSPTGGGAYVRQDAGTGAAITVLINGTLVQALPEIKTSADGRNWVHIHAGNIDGWVLTTVLAATTATPTAPALTLTLTLTPNP